MYALLHNTTLLLACHQLTGFDFPCGKSVSQCETKSHSSVQISKFCSRHPMCSSYIHDLEAQITTFKYFRRSMHRFYSPACYEVLVERYSSTQCTEELATRWVHAGCGDEHASIRTRTTRCDQSAKLLAHSSQSRALQWNDMVAKTPIVAFVRNSSSEVDFTIDKNVRARSCITVTSLSLLCDVAHYDNNHYANRTEVFEEGELDRDRVMSYYALHQWLLFDMSELPADRPVVIVDGFSVAWIDCYSNEHLERVVSKLPKDKITFAISGSCRDSQSSVPMTCLSMESPAKTLLHQYDELGAPITQDHTCGLPHDCRADDDVDTACLPLSPLYKYANPRAIVASKQNLINALELIMTVPSECFKYQSVFDMMQVFAVYRSDLVHLDHETSIFYPADMTIATRDQHTTSWTNVRVKWEEQLQDVCDERDVHIPIQRHRPCFLTSM